MSGGSEIPDPLERLITWLGSGDVEKLLNGKRPHVAGQGAQSSGPMVPTLRCSAAGVEVEQYTATEWDRECVYHQYWREHDYKTLEPELKAVAPPRPSKVRRAAFFTWAQVGAELRRRVEPEQLSLYWWRHDAP